VLTGRMCFITMVLVLAFFLGKIAADDVKVNEADAPANAAPATIPEPTGGAFAAAASDETQSGSGSATGTADGAKQDIADPAADFVAIKKLMFDLAGSVGISPGTAVYIAYVFLAVYFLSFVNSMAANLWRRLELWANGLVHMVFSTDARFKPKHAPNPDLVVSAMSGDLMCSHPTRRILFIRHGESRWNEVFNRGLKPAMLIALVKAIVEEIFSCFGNNSIFLDSPLSKLGKDQAVNLSHFVSEDPGNLAPDVARDRDALVGLRPSTIVSSNLRRAIATICIGLWPRLKKDDKEKIHILSSLQEGSRNVDCICLAGPGQVPPLSSVKKLLETETFTHTAKFNTDFNKGNKPVFSNGLDRFKEFCAFCMMPQLEGKTIVVGGHSLWFKKFFQTFLPRNVDHDAKNCKMANAAVVGITLTGAVVNGEWVYRIDPKSITEVYGPKDAKNPLSTSFIRKAKK